MAATAKFISVCVLLILSIYSRCAVKAHATKKPSDRFHTVNSTTLFPSNGCNQSLRGKGTTSLPLVHRHGPCIQLLDQSQRAAKRPSPSELVAQDQSRADWIHARGSGPLDESNAQIPSQALGSAAYVVKVGLGTPEQQVTLVFDTGSDLTWAQCKQCAELGSCYSQSDALFDPAASTSYTNISCSSPLCGGVTPIPGDASACVCGYTQEYLDNSKSSGILSTDTLTLTPSETLKSFIFGCSLTNAGLPGILGLSRGKRSLPSQSAATYNGLFSYCIPKSISSTGFLNLGGPVPAAAQFTPFSTVPRTTSYYGVDITAITVGGEALPIDQSVFSVAGTVVDSGTTFTRLPPKAHAALVAKFEDLMSAYPRAKTASSVFELCYDLSASSGQTIQIPAIRFEFSGGAKVELGSSGILVADGSLEKVCLAFVRNENDDDVAIFGNSQQAGYEVVFDAPNSRVGFAPAMC